MVIIGTGLKIDQDLDMGWIKFENNSDSIVEIYLIPTPPKRKVNCIRVIQPNSFVILDKIWNMDLNNLYFRFKK